jgi:hypothetical protein
MSNTSDRNPKDGAQSDRLRDQQLAYTTPSRERLQKLRRHPSMMKKYGVLM